MTDNLKLLLSILLDKAAQKDVERGLDSISKDIEKIDEQKLDNVLGEFDKILRKMDDLTKKAMRDVDKKFSQTRREIEKLNRAAAGLGRVGVGLSAAGGAVIGAYTLSAKNYVDYIEKAGIKNDEVANRWLAATKKIESAQLSIGQATATALLPYLEQAAGLIEKIATAVQQNPEAVKNFLQVAGAASILGAIAIAVSKGLKIYGDALYIAALADHSLAMRELIAGISISKIGGMGALGVKFPYTKNSAGRWIDPATGKFVSGAKVTEAQTAFAGQPYKPPTVIGGALGKAGQAIGTVALYASAVVIGAELGAALGNALGKLVYGEGYKKQGINDALLTASRLANTPLALLAATLEKAGGKAGEFGDQLGDNITKSDQFMQKLLGIDKSTDDAAGGLRDFNAEAEKAAAAAEKAAQATQNYASAMKVASDLSAANAQAERQFQAGIAQIYSSAGSSYSAAGNRLRTNLAKIDTDLKSNLAKLSADFASEQIEAEQDFQKQRAETIQQANENVKQIREDAQEQLRQLEQDHSDRMYDLAISRDALGIIQENRRFEREKAEIASNTQKQVAEVRKQAQIQLTEQRQAFVEQQNERRKEYELQVKEAKMQAEQQRKEAELAHAQEIRDIGRQVAERAAELRRGYYEERRQRIQAANEQIRDLGITLQNERQLRMQYYMAMIGDTRSFMSSYQAALNMTRPSTISGKTGVITAASGTSTTSASRFPPLFDTHQIGGYGPGIVGRGDEFILNPRSTRAAESLIGARLNQNNLLAAMRGNVTLNDQRRFYGGISPEEKRMIDESTREQVEYLVGG